MKVANTAGLSTRYRVKVQPRAEISDEEVARRQAARNAKARENLLSEFGALTEAEVAERAIRTPAVVGTRKVRPAVSGWKRKGLLFTVVHQGRQLFPAFQLDEKGHPRPVVADVLTTLGTRSHGWELALWFTSANGLLDGRRPVDLIATNPAAISEAARREAFGFIF